MQQDKLLIFLITLDCDRHGEREFDSCAGSLVSSKSVITANCIRNGSLYGF